MTAPPRTQHPVSEGVMSEHNSTPIRAVCYYRMSSEEQEGSIEQQQAWARPAAQKENIDIVAEFIDAAKKGHETATREDFHRMLDYCREQHRRRQPVDAIVCWKTNRFSRSDSNETSWFIWEFRKVGVNLFYTSANGWI